MKDLQEYDLNIKPAHSVKGHGLCKLTTEVVHAHEEEQELIGWEQEIEMYDVERALPTS